MCHPGSKMKLSLPGTRAFADTLLPCIAGGKILSELGPRPGTQGISEWPCLVSFEHPSLLEVTYCPTVPSAWSSG